jgi:hypothetical protein
MDAVLISGSRVERAVDAFWCAAGFQPNSRKKFYSRQDLKKNALCRDPVTESLRIDRTHEWTSRRGASGCRKQGNGARFGKFAGKPLPNNGSYKER